MIKTVVKAVDGFEKQFDELNEMKANLENEKEIAKNEAIAEVDRKFAERENKINDVLAMVSTTEEIEVEDEEVAENEVTKEQTQVEAY